MKNVRLQQVADEIETLSNKYAFLPGRFYFYLASARKGLRQRDRAIKSLQSFLKIYPEHARVQVAKFKIGRNYWNLGQRKKALEYFSKVLAMNPSSEWAIKALFFSGKIHEERKDYNLAVEIYTAVRDRYGDDEHAQWAAWRIGWVYYLLEKYKTSFEKFQDAARRFPTGFFIESNLYWGGRATEKADIEVLPKDIFANVYEKYPYTYYGIRARQKLVSMNVLKTEPIKGNRAAKEKMETRTNAPPSLNRELTPREKFFHTRAVELSKMGFYENARLQTSRLGETIQKNLTGVLWLSDLFNQARGYADTLRILHLYKDFKTKEGERKLSERFWKNFFPMAYAETIREFAKTYNVDPFFVKSLIRQESLFDSQSLSRAGARGLMQIMPNTGKQLYRHENNGIPFETDSLFDPNLNIRLGIKYLSQLNKRFGKNGTHILISYNAGPHILKKWLKRFQDMNDPDVFIESIPYPETRRYVKHVMRNYGIYKALYDQ